MDRMFKKKPAVVVDPRKEFVCEMKLLILGSPHSGKTTVMRHFQLISDDTSVDKRHSQRVMYANTIATVSDLLTIVEKLGLQVSGDNKERVDRIKALPSGATEFRMSKFPLQLVYDFSCVWRDEAIQTAYEHALRSPEDTLTGRPQYYMENMFRIFSPDFKPEDLDVLSAYDHAGGASQSAEVYYRKVKILAQCIPGDVTDAHKWDALDCFPDVILFTVNLTNFDRKDSQNHLQTSLATLEHIAQNWEPFNKAHCIILLLNYKDLFMERAAVVDLKCCFPEYKGGLDATEALAYVTSLFTNKVAGKGVAQRVYTTNLLDKKTTTAILDEMMDILTPEFNKRSAGFSDVNNNTILNNTTTSAGSPNTSSNNLNIYNGKHTTPPTAEVVERKELTTSKDKDKDKDKEKEKKKKVKGIVSVESGVESVQGRRKAMEDTHVIIDDFRTQFPSYSNLVGQCGYFAVYDGHGGVETSKIVEQLLHKNILDDPQFATANYEAGIKSGFALTDAFVLKQPSKSGSTAVVALLIGNQLFVANAGDSEAILGRQIGAGKKAKHEYVVLSYKHLPTDEQEKQRISAAGGLVVFGRLFGSLAVSRSFGDKDFKDGAHFVSAEPYILQMELTPADQFIVMACDGLWDKLTYEDVINSVTRLRKEGKSATEIGKALVQEALEKESLDNITVVVVFFQWKK